MKLLQCPYQVFLHPLPIPIWAGVFHCCVVKTWAQGSRAGIHIYMFGAPWVVEVGLQVAPLFFSSAFSISFATSPALAQRSGVFSSAAGEKASPLPPRTALRGSEEASAVGTHGTER